MVDIATHYKWNYVSLVYSSGEYGELAADAFKKAARRDGVCIATEEKISKFDQLPDIVATLFDKLVTNNDKREGARVVVLFTRNDHGEKLLAEAHRQLQARRQWRPVPKIIWLASEAWETSNPNFVRGVESTAEGALVLALKSERVPRFEDYYLSLRPGTEQFKRNDWLKELWLSHHGFECRFKENKDGSRRASNSAQMDATTQKENDDSDEELPDCDDLQPTAPSANFAADTKVQFVIDAVYAMAHALHNQWMDTCDIVGRTFHFDSAGDGPAYYSILNYGKWDGKLGHEYRPVGAWRKGQLSMDDGTLFWHSPFADAWGSFGCLDGF